MPFSINNFRAQLVGQGSRPSQFEVTLPFPASVNPGDAGSKFTFMAKAASIPDSTIAPIDIPYFGRNIKTYGSRAFAEWSTTVINDEDFAVHAGLINWMNAMNTHETNIKTISGGDFMVDAQVTHYKKEGAVSKQISLINCWPSTVAAIELGWDQGDAIEEFAVTWQYDYWMVADDRSQTT